MQRKHSGNSLIVGLFQMTMAHFSKVLQPSTGRAVLSQVHACPCSSSCPGMPHHFCLENVLHNHGNRSPWCKMTSKQSLLIPPVPPASRLLLLYGAWDPPHNLVPQKVRHSELYHLQLCIRVLLCISHLPLYLAYKQDLCPICFLISNG